MPLSNPNMKLRVTYMTPEVKIVEPLTQNAIFQGSSSNDFFITGISTGNEMEEGDDNW